jgi:hypothetical protein
MMIFYERAIEHFESLGTDVLIKMPDNWVFGFQYFPSLAPVNIVYDRLPKNNLILTDIQILNDSGRIIKTIADPYYIHTYLCYSPRKDFYWLPWQWEFIPQNIKGINNEWITPVTLQYILFQK